MILCQRREELLHEERIALRSGARSLPRVRIGIGSENASQHVGGLSAAKRLELHDFARSLAREGAEQSSERMTGVELVGSVSRDEQELERHGVVGEPVQQLERCLIGPVDVLEDEEHWVLGCQSGEHAVDQPRTARAGGACRCADLL